MTYDFTKLKKEVENTHIWLQKEFSSIRTGKASPAILDSIFVEAYNSHMPINQIGSVSIEDPRTLRVSIWDTALIKNAETAVEKANMGVSVGSDEKGLRVFFPDLTSERREALMRVAKAKLEEARITLRSERDNVWSKIQEKERAGDISEDDKFSLKEEMQKKIDDGNTALEALYKKKEAEILL